MYQKAIFLLCSLKEWSIVCEGKPNESSASSALVDIVLDDHWYDMTNGSSGWYAHQPVIYYAMPDDGLNCN